MVKKQKKVLNTNPPVSPLKLRGDQVGLIIAATHSGAGKTTIALGLMAAWKKRELKVQPFKVGPDFIDPGYHQHVCQYPSINLDSFILSPSYIRKIFANNLYGKDIGIIEGAMGLFDGLKTVGATPCGCPPGSTAQIAKILNLPIILIVDVKGMGQSAAAIVNGFKNFDPQIKIVGIILNRVGSKNHFELLKEVIEHHCQIKVVGFFPADKNLTIKERHLGLVTARENNLANGKSLHKSKNFLNKLILQVEETINLEMLWEISKTYTGRPGVSPLQKHHPKYNIAVANDLAFSFYYHDNLDLLKSSGAKIIFFSPLSSKKLPEKIDAIYLGGGYPEIYARKLEKNLSLRKEIKKFAEEGGKIYAECGGFMYLTKGIKDLKGKLFKMVGIFPTIATMLNKRKALGYREILLKENCLLGKAGEVLKGHEYHYSEIIPLPAQIKRIYAVKDQSDEGYLYKNTLASYIHIHFGSKKGKKLFL